MERKPLKILAINPGSRYLGIALFKESELKDWGVKVINIKGKCSEEKWGKVKGILSNLIEQHEPNVLAIKRFHPSRISLNLKRLAEKIKEFSRRKGIKIYQYSISELEKFFAPEEKMNKRKLACLVASRYPELVNELEKEKSHKNPYHIRTFEAVALGSICFHKLDKNYAKE